MDSAPSRGTRQGVPTGVAATLLDVREYAGSGFGGETAHSVRLDFYVPSPTNFGPLAPGYSATVYQGVRRYAADGSLGMGTAAVASSPADRSIVTMSLSISSSQPVTGPWSRTYDSQSQNLLQEQRVLFRAPMVESSARYRYASRQLAQQGVTPCLETSSATTNFMGQPLSKSTNEYQAFSSTITRTTNADYAYWGADKYYQQKAVRTGEGQSNYRYSCTDYYPSNANAGRRGQAYRVYDPKNASFITTADAGHPAPPIALGQSQSDYDAKVWKYTLHPSSDLNYSAQFDYETQGRPTDVWKLQKTTTSPWSYVQTHYHVRLRRGQRHLGPGLEGGGGFRRH